MSVAMQRLVDLISMVTNSTLLCNNTGTEYPTEIAVSFHNCDRSGIVA
jgi:hypothetical protein